MDTIDPAAGPTPDPAPASPSAGTAAAVPPEAFPMLDASGMVILPRRCISCSYNLMGLHAEGLCPECGTPIALSLRDNLLINSAPEYLKRIHKGVFLVQAAIIVMIVLALVGFFGVMIAGLVGAGRGPVSIPGSIPFPSNGTSPGTTPTGTASGTAMGGGFMIAIVYGSAFVSIAIACVGLYGWWLFSEADPRASENDKGEKPRRIVRTTVVIELALLVVSQAVNLATGAGLGGVGTMFGAAMIVSMLCSLSYYIALATRYFASMLYIRWLAPRLPNEKVHRRGKLMLWLGPVLCTVGVAACGLGPLVALVLYYNLLEWVRVDLKRIRKTLELKSMQDAGSAAPA
jgi:hypothetical protein